ncbi:MAG: type II secretion system F family protein [Xanthobacteraceae bacterium]
MSHAFLALPIFILCAVAMLCVLVAVCYPRVRKDYPLNQRFELIAETGAVGTTQRGGNDAIRKRSVEETVREAADKAKKRAKPSLATRLRQAQLDWSKTKYYVVCFVVTAVISVVVMMTGLGAIPALGFGISAGVLLPHFYVSLKRRRRFKQFTANLADAVDVIVRGVKVGLPLAECFKIVAREARSPIKEEFQIIVDDQAVGLPLADATERLPDRVPIPEARFFSIVIAIQSRTGGSLAEALGNLSKVLRDRQKMRGKIKALSSEAKASAGIISALPVAVIAILSVVNPTYIGLLFNNSSGHMVLGACVVLMAIGCLVMRKMINFQI